MTVNIFGREYPIKYTIAAENAIAERAGGLENLNAAMEKEGAAGRMDILAAMLAAGLYGVVTAVFKVKFGTNETLLTSKKRTPRPSK